MPNKDDRIPGYRIQPMLPIHTGLFGSRCDDAKFSTWDGQPCVTAHVWLGLAKSPYVLHLTIDQALAADIVEKVE